MEPLSTRRRTRQTTPSGSAASKLSMYTLVDRSLLVAKLSSTRGRLAWRKISQNINGKDGTASLNRAANIRVWHTYREFDLFRLNAERQLGFFVAQNGKIDSEH